MQLDNGAVVWGTELLSALSELSWPNLDFHGQGRESGNPTDLIPMPNACCRAWNGELLLEVKNVRTEEERLYGRKSKGDRPSARSQPAVGGYSPMEADLRHTYLSKTGE